MEQQNQKQKNGLKLKETVEEEEEINIIGPNEDSHNVLGIIMHKNIRPSTVNDNNKNQIE